MNNYNAITDSKYGKMIYNIHDYVIGQSIDAYGEWCEGEIELLSKLIHPGMTVIDGGANIGTHSLAFSNIVGKNGKVLAFEPQRHLFYILAGNVAINSIDNIWCYYNALSNKPGVLRVGQLNFEAPYNFGALQIEEQVHMETFEEVSIVCIDDLGLKACDLIKADVEGMEEKTLRGAEKTILAFRPLLYIEDERPEKTDSLIAYIRSLGYEMYWHLTQAFNPHNYKANNNDLLGGYVSKNILCIPIEKPIDLYPLGQIYKI